MFLPRCSFGGARGRSSKSARPMAVVPDAMARAATACGPPSVSFDATGRAMRTCRARRHGRRILRATRRPLAAYSRSPASRRCGSRRAGPWRARPGPARRSAPAEGFDATAVAPPSVMAWAQPVKAGFGRGNGSRSAKGGSSRAWIPPGARPRERIARRVCSVFFGADRHSAASRRPSARLERKLRPSKSKACRPGPASPFPRTSARGYTRSPHGVSFG
jgi:hypothetical protein